MKSHYTFSSIVFLPHRQNKCSEPWDLTKFYDNDSLGNAFSVPSNIFITVGVYMHVLVGNNLSQPVSNECPG